MQSTLNALYTQYDVDLVISSHDHVYERILKDGVAYFVTGGGGADLYDFDTPVEGSEVRVKENHAMIVDIDGGLLEINVFGTDGSILDTYSIEKEPGATPTPTPGETPTPGDPADPSGPQPGGCAVAGSGASPLSFAPLAAFALLLLVRRRR
jgi:MYXO-CTERM domain-containing protein